MKAEYINPFVRAAVDVFATMLDCELTRGEISLNSDFQPEHEISGIIGLSGRAVGTVVVSLSRGVALSATEALLGTRPQDVDAEVIDAVGELTNMIAGQAKSKLEPLSLSLALPTVITGTQHTIKFGSAAKTICIPFSCDWGALSVEVGLAEQPVVADR